ncbi:choice-of-anchor B family protein [soil metagenome]
MPTFVRPLLLVLLAGALALPAEAQSFGASLAVSGDRIFVGEGGTALRPGAVHILTRGSDGVWAAAEQLQSPDAGIADSFGRALAADAHAGASWLLVGVPERNTAYLFRATAGEGAGSWELAHTLVPNEANEGFGAAVAMDAERGVLAVGAAGAGAVHTYRVGADGAVTRLAGLLPAEASEEAEFGGALLLAGDRLYVGAPGDREAAGSVSVFRAVADSWDLVTTIRPQGSESGDRFGSGLAADGPRVLVGAPGSRGAGAALLFQAATSGLTYNLVGSLVAYDGRPGQDFGSAVAVSSGETWIASAAGLHRFQRDGQFYTSSARVALDTPGRGMAPGGSVAMHGEVAVLGLPGAVRGAGGVAVLQRDDDGDWTQAAVFTAEAEMLPRIVTGETLPCEEGRVGEFFTCSNVEILSFLPISDIGGEDGIRLNDTWGWHDEETGREVVLVGRTNGVAFVDITNPNNPVYVGEVLKTDGSPNAAWRDFKVYRDHAFIVADASGQHGMQVFNLRRLDDFDGEPITFEPDYTYDRIHSAHNIGLNEDTGVLYIVGASQGGETCGGGLHMVDANDPGNPEFLGCFADPRTGRTGTGYSHDVQCVTYHGPDERYTDREICMGSNETHLSVADVTDKANPGAVSIASYPNVGDVHQGWFDEDHQYFYMQDELALMQGLIDNTRTVIFDVSDLEDPQVVGEFFYDTRAVSHNLYVRDNLMFEANYSSGLRILDITDRENPVEVGWIDTAPTHAAEPMFEGAWSTYPYFRNGVVSVSSIGEGLFLVRFADPRPVS